MTRNQVNNRIKTALRKSIKKWTNIEAGKGVDKKGANCALCQMFNTNDCAKIFTLDSSAVKTNERYITVNCPVKMKTKITGCVKSPYEKWEDHHNSRNQTPKFSHHDRHGHLRLVDNCKTCQRLATSERKFLERLLKNFDKLTSDGFGEVYEGIKR